ncbi:hypothetical protein D3C81_2058810 [compost metagenome]
MLFFVITAKDTIQSNLVDPLLLGQCLFLCPDLGVSGCLSGCFNCLLFFVLTAQGAVVANLINRLLFSKSPVSRIDYSLSIGFD